MCPAGNKLMNNYGWVQNTSNLSTIRDTIDLVPEHGICHLDLRENIRTFRDDNNDLPNRWTWDARCRIKAITACGLVRLNRNIAGYELTELGQLLKNCPKASETVRGKRILTVEEKELFKSGLLTNAPVIRVLELLNEERRTTSRGLSKYDIGEQLGFVGDPGFTHIDPEWVVVNGYSFNDKEGDADKWARTIISWLRQVGWVVKSDEPANVSGRSLIRYKATPEVDNVLRYNSKRIGRYVPTEMLCSDKHPFPKLIQKRRAIILRHLSEKLRREFANVSDIISELVENGIEADDNLIRFEVLALGQAGFRIHQEGSNLKLEDRIYLDIEQTLFEVAEEECESELEKLIEQMVVRFEETIPIKLVDSLIRYGYDGSESTNFESTVAQYFRFLGYDADHIGQGHGRTADVIARHIDDKYAKSYGIIIDAKATTDKYTFPAGDIRKMKEYILMHGPILLQEHHIPNHAYAFISPDFCERFEGPLLEISNDTAVNGCAIEVIKLLELGSLIRIGTISIDNLHPYFTTNSLFEINSQH